jgi:hypothetical protein
VLTAGTPTGRPLGAGSSCDGDQRADHGIPEDAVPVVPCPLCNDSGFVMEAETDATGQTTGKPYIFVPKPVQLELFSDGARAVAP